MIFNNETKQKPDRTPPTIRRVHALYELVHQWREEDDSLVKDRRQEEPANGNTTAKLTKGGAISELCWVFWRDIPTSTIS